MTKAKSKAAEFRMQEARALESLKRSLTTSILEQESVEREDSPESLMWPSGNGKSESRSFPDIYAALKAVAARLREISQQQAAEKKMAELAAKKADAAERSWAADFIGRWASASAEEQKRGIIALLSFAGRGIKVAGKTYALQAQLVGDIALSMWSKGTPVEKLAAKFPGCGEELSLSFFLSSHALDKLEKLVGAGALSWGEWESVMPDRRKPWCREVNFGEKIENHAHAWLLWVRDLFYEHERDGKSGSPSVDNELKIMGQLSGFAKRCPESKAALISWAEEVRLEIKEMAEDATVSSASMSSVKRAIDVALKSLDIAEAKPMFLEAKKALVERLRIEDKCWSWVAALRGAIEVDGVRAARMIVREIRKISPRGLGSYDSQAGGLLRIAANAGAMDCLKMLLDEDAPVSIAWSSRGEPETKLSPFTDAMRLALGKVSGIDEASGKRALGRMCRKWRDQLMAQRGIDASEAAGIVEDHLRKSMSKTSASSGVLMASRIEAEIISQAINLRSKHSLDDELLGKPKKPAMRL